MKASEAALAIIRQYEGLRLEAYCCPAGKWTIGYGSTVNVKPGMKISAAQADARLRKDVASAEAAVNKLVKWPIQQHHFDALVSFTFNVGAGALERSTMLKKINAGDLFAAANEFRRWVFAGESVLPGLQVRRSAERALFLNESLAHSKSKEGIT